MAQSKLAIFIFSCLSMVALAACQPGGGPSARAPQAPAGEGNNPFEAAGTFQGGGGGNGVDGETMESYAKSYARDIETLPEYKRYIAPILRKMNQGRADVFVLYLRWAAREKAWFFVPNELPKLPKEQIQVDFETEQHGRHYDQEIYIHGPTYDEKELQDKAMLLLHEMVMGAKFLMKKSPQAQCEALSKAEHLAACQDPANLKLAIPYTAVTDKETYSANGVDHERIRAMTLFLINPDSDLSAATVYAMRSRLGFQFPWDPLLSKFTLADFVRVIDRSFLAEDVFTTKDNFLSAEPRTCLMKRWALVAHLDINHWVAEIPEGVRVSTIRAENDDWLNGLEAKSLSFLGSSFVSLKGQEALYTITGVPDDSENGRIYDRVRILPSLFSWPTGTEGIMFDFYITRDPNPRLVKYVGTPVKVLRSTEINKAAYYQGEIEFVPVASKKPVVCSLK